ncbi:MAG: single-stranded DNA-binding protein [Campylobacteraceae bacterium 4484_4]|nr:MAG: single-stranded DNA-binding protein [Campylobacteraceae bacterium 4484_4]
MFNKVIMVGNLTRDIELRYLPSGTAVGSSGIATSRKFKSGSGEQKEETCFIDITFFGRTAEIANQYLKKGSKVLLEGRLRYETWEDQHGNKRSKHSITVDNMQMLDSRASAGESGGYGAQSAQGGYQQPSGSYNAPQQTQPGRAAPEPKNEIPEIDIDDDEIPF